MIKLPYHKQEFSYSCFDACLRMVLEFYGVKKSEKELRLLCKTTPTYGTIWSIVKERIRQIGFEFVWNRYTSFDELKKLIQDNIPVIASIDTFYFGDVESKGHVVVVVDVLEDFVVVDDPEKGERIKVKKETFLSAWKSRKCLAGYVRKE
jgi:predicted double-glycine peptidase